jgi:N-acetylneuraminic acid mutarotase
MIYDSSNQNSVLFGGNSWSSGQLNDTWTYDYAGNSWQRLNPTFYPSARKWSDMIYDSALQKSILFGGSGGGDYLSDTWIFDLSTNNWSKMNVSLKPSGRSLCELVYDSFYQKIILFGGNNENGTMNDTWVYDSSSNTWLAMDLKTNSVTIYTPKLFLISFGIIFFVMCYQKRKFPNKFSSKYTNLKNK